MRLSLCPDWLAYRNAFGCSSTANTRHAEAATTAKDTQRRLPSESWQTTIRSHANGHCLIELVRRTSSSAGLSLGSVLRKLRNVERKKNSISSSLIATAVRTSSVRGVFRPKRTLQDILIAHIAGPDFGRDVGNLGNAAPYTQTLRIGDASSHILAP